MNYFNKLIFIILAISWLFTNIPISFSKEKITDYQLEVTLGEYQLDNYSGPGDILTYSDKNKHAHYFFEKKYYKNVINRAFNDNLIYLNDSFFTNLISTIKCPNFILNTHITYIRYIYRLIIISYLFEAIKEYKKISEHLGLKITNCSLKWDNLFAHCSPKFKEMKKFLQRLKPYYKDTFIEKKNNEWELEKKNIWKKRLNTKTKDPIISSLNKWYRDNRIRTNKNEIDFIKKGISHLCKQSTDLLHHSCNETDSLYGVSNAPWITQILKTSIVMNIIDKEGHGYNCLNRYVSIFKNQEMNYPWLNELTKKIVNRFRNISSRYLEGPLFVPGALKEFDDMGLSDFLFALPKIMPTPNPTVQVVAKPAPTIIPTIKPTLRPVVKIIKIKSYVIATPVPTPKISEFEKISKRRKKSKLKMLNLNMLAMKNDYIFTNKMITQFNDTLKVYQTRKALSDMKKYNGLGEEKEPIRLLFLKYLIDTGKHQGLYNIIGVIGEKFYVINDIEKKNNPEYIKLENSEKTSYKWQITILKQPSKKRKIYINNQKNH